jgi:MOSC domain-containing protein YiiM
MGRLISVNVGMPKNVSWKEKIVYTGIWKASVDGPVMARRLNLDGDDRATWPGTGVNTVR